MLSCKKLEITFWQRIKNDEKLLTLLCRYSIMSGVFQIYVERVFLYKKELQSASLKKGKRSMYA